MIRYPTDIDKKMRVLESLSNLEYNEAFKVVFDWLSEESARISKDNDSIKDDITLRWSQGHCQLLWDLLGKATTARTTLNKLRSQAPPKGRA